MPSAPDLSGTALDDRYELHAVIGEGAFGRVYRGRDRRLARPVAVKVIKPWWTDDPEWAATFQREAQLLASVNDPGIVQIFDVGHAPEGLYYVSELVDGENLASRLRRGPLPPWEACGLAAQLCRALARAHAQRVVHRDVKPANILLSAQGRVKVGDFGVARLAEGSTDPNGTHPPTIVGTPKYMAPEQGRGLPTTPATDVYSVGVVLYEMLAGEPPFSHGTAVELALAHLQDPPPRLPDRLPAPLIAIIDRALTKDPGERYANGAEMAQALLDARRQFTGGRRARLAPGRTRSTPHAARRALVPAGADTATGGGKSESERPADADHPTARLALAPPSRQPARPRTGATPPQQPDATRAAPRLSPRRNVNPSGRRRAAAALGLVVALLVAMAAAAVILGSVNYTRVPRLTGRSHSSAMAAARRAHVRLAFSRRYDRRAAAGVLFTQHPGAGTRVTRGTRVQVVLSRGPAPVKVPAVGRERAADAEQWLRSLQLRPVTREVPAPGRTPGTVVGQTPPAGETAAVGSIVTLSLAETPQWRPATTFQGFDSGPFQIIGERWRIVYRMAFEGTCTWILFCSGPSAHVRNAATGATVTSFGMTDGGQRSRTVTTGPGRYEIEITPGGDHAGWSMQVQDDY